MKDQVTNWSNPLLPQQHVGACNTPWPAKISIQEWHWKPFLEILIRNGQIKGQWPLYSIPVKRISRCIYKFGANLVILAQIHFKLLHGKAKFPRILSHNGQNDLKGEGQWPLFSITAKSITECVLVANLVILSQICDELSCGQIKFLRILSQNGQNDLEGQCQWPLFSNPDKGIPRCMFGANLVIPAQICDELLRGQAKFPTILRQNG